MEVKKILFCVCILLLTNYVFSEEIEGIVIDDNLRIRDMPSLSSTIIGEMNKNDKIIINSYAGTGRFIDGVLDYWACISEDGKRWINAWWITEKPIVITMYQNSTGFICPYEIDALSNQRMSQLYSTFYRFLDMDLFRNKYHSIEANFIFDENKCIKTDEKYNEKYYDYNKILFCVINDIVNASIVIKNIEITNPSVKIMAGIHVGMCINEFRDIFNLPYNNHKSGSFWIKQDYGEGLIITFEDGNISSLIWQSAY